MNVRQKRREGGGWGFRGILEKKYKKKLNGEVTESEWEVLKSTPSILKTQI